MASVNIELPTTFDEALYKHVTAIANEAIEQVRKDMTITKDFLSYNEVTKNVLDVSRGTLMKWISLGLPVYQIDGKQFFKRKDLYNFIETYKNN